MLYWCPRYITIHISHIVSALSGRASCNHTYQALGLRRDMGAAPCLVLLLFFGTSLLLPQPSRGATRHYTFNVSAFQACICMVLEYY